MDDYNTQNNDSDQPKDVKNTPLTAKLPSASSLAKPGTSTENANQDNAAKQTQATKTKIKPVQNTEVETFSPVKREQNTQLAPIKPASKWAFWKKGKQRDEQLSRISDGYIEIVDMVRSIRDQADAQHQNNIILRDSLIHLPSAIQSLEGFGKSHEQVGQALGKINEQMENYSIQDKRMANTMEGFNDTLKGMDGTSKATIKTFDRVQERMRDSDIRMENLFSNVRQSEEKVSETMTRLQRNMSIFQALFLLCLIGLIGGLIYLFINKEDFRNTPAQAPVAQQQHVDPGTNTVNPSDQISSDQTPVEVAPIEGTTPAVEENVPAVKEVTPNEVVPHTPTEEAPSEIHPEDIIPEDIIPEEEPNIEQPEAEQLEAQQPQSEEPTI